jgi:hypothetical protein
MAAGQTVTTGSSTCSNRLGDNVAVQPEGGGAISAPGDALGFVDLIEKGDYHRAHVNRANWEQSATDARRTSRPGPLGESQWGRGGPRRRSFAERK